MASLRSPSLSITSAFAVPVIETIRSDSATFNASLRSLFLQWRADPTHVRRSIPTEVVKVGVYESGFDLFSNANADVQSLRSYCLNTLGYVIARLNHYDDSRMAALRIYAHSWYHLTEHAGYTAQHNHPMASWSGVYCVDPGDSVAGQPNSGTLRFSDPRGTAAMYVDPGNARLDRPFGFGTLAYTLVPGRLLLFPSYLIHEVAPYFGQRVRITVAFNAWVREAGHAVDAPFVRKREAHGD